MDSSREVDIGEDVEFPEKSLMEEESRNIEEEEICMDLKNHLVKKPGQITRRILWVDS
jgi:hypothetical protein